MILFHGTGGTRETIESIVAEGLRPHGGRDWAGALTGVDTHVFVCTTPIGTRDGDPVRWAQGGAWKQRRAWLVVIEIPDDELAALCVGAVRNEDLTRYWRARELVHITVERDLPETLAAIARGAPARDHLRYVTVKSDVGVTDAETLVQFDAAYYRASPRQKARVAASYGVQVPAWFSDDSHYPSCQGCVHHLFDVQLEIAGQRFSRGSFTRIDRETFGNYLDALGRWLGPHAAELAGKPTLDLHRFESRHPPPADVPRALSRDLLRGDLAARMRVPDSQLLLRAVSRDHIVGALDLGSAHRLSPLVRPSRGQTLLDNLRHQIGELRTARASLGRAVIRSA